MTRYSDLEPSHEFKELRPVDEASLEHLRRAFGPVPTDYLEFLEELGSGTVGPSPGAFKVYPGLVESAELHQALSSETPGDVVLFGDDFQGYSFGFRRSSNWELVEVSPDGRAVEPLDQSFEEFIRELIANDQELP